MNMENICLLCKKICFKYANLECDHKFCKNCLYDYVYLELKQNRSDFPLKCPEKTCDKTEISKKLLKKIFEKVDFKDLMKKNIKKCEICNNEVNKRNMKKLEECDHKACSECSDNNKICINCKRNKFTEEIKQNNTPELRKNASLESAEKKKCRLCKISKKSQKLSCCDRNFCFECLKNTFHNQMKEALDKQEEIKDFSLKCPKCDEKFDDLSLLEDVLDEDDWKLYQITFCDKKRCRICKNYKKSKEILKIFSCKHKICKKCWTDYLKTCDDKKLVLCPKSNCDYRANIEDMRNENKKFNHLLTKIEENEKIINPVNENFNGAADLNEQFQKKETLLYENYYIKNNLIMFSDIKEENNNSKIKINENSQLRKDFKPEIPDTLPRKASQHHIMVTPKPPETKINCEICICEFNVDEILTLECEHRFCIECLIKDWKTKISEGLISETSIICPKEKCKRPIDFFILKSNLPEELFKKYENLLTNHAISNQMKEKQIKCPNCSSIAFIPIDYDFFDCLGCKNRYCANEKCLKKWSEHNHPCEYFYKTKNVEDEKEFMEYVKINKLKKCPVCGVIVEKIKNCNYIQCCSNKCQKKTVFCYLCGEILKQKDLSNHYLNNSPYSKCKSWVSPEKTPPVFQKTTNLNNSFKSQEIKEIIQHKVINQEEFKANYQNDEKKFLKNERILEYYEICNKCNRSMEFDHCKIIMEDVECYFICLNTTNYNIFCKFCSVSLAQSENFKKHMIRMHFNKFKKEITYLSEILISPYNETLNLSNIFNCVDCHYPNQNYFGCLYCKSNLENHRHIKLFHKYIPICSNTILNDVYCYICKTHTTINYLHFHN